MKEIDAAVRDATLSLQVIHTSLTEGMYIAHHHHLFFIFHFCELPMTHYLFQCLMDV